MIGIKISYLLSYLSLNARNVINWTRNNIKILRRTKKKEVVIIRIERYFSAFH